MCCQYNTTAPLEYTHSASSQSHFSLGYTVYVQGFNKSTSTSQVKNKNSSTRNKHDPDDSDSSSSVGSLEAVDLVEEDLNRNETTRAAGFFGKNSEVAWMQRLEDDIEHKSSYSGSRLQSHSGSSAAVSQSQSPLAGAAVLPSQDKWDRDIPIAMMNYHLDDLDIPMVSDYSDPMTVPPREIADKYFDAYMTYVHPTFSILRKSTFTGQYRQFFNRHTQPPRKWLGILNMIFAIGCRYCKLLDPGAGSAWEDGLVYLTRARQLSLHENVLFEHTDLQQIQLEFLVAVYLLCLGQVNRYSKLILASKFAFHPRVWRHTDIKPGHLNSPAWLFALPYLSEPTFTSQTVEHTTLQKKPAADYGGPSTP